ncbi:MAG: hypothetical protein M3O82_06360 [Verrucomicrobiota bacterium]|nr:hypothetical protein [Verrucomicrobiota bacterium]
MKNALISTVWLVLFLALSAATRCSNYRDVFLNGQIYFVDADCYSRMTRVRTVIEHPGVILRHHDFENYPTGTTPHTTAPFDYLIAAIAWGLKPFSKNHVDLAGAIVSPILGLFTTAFLWIWSRFLVHRFRKVMMFLVAMSPVLVHGTILGRPDHQSLLIFLMTVALGAELAIASAPAVGWGIISGIAWGLGLWVSLYEPLILMAALFLTKLFFFRPKLFVRERVPGYLLLLAVLGIAYALEGWRLTVPDATTMHYFQNWKRSIGELSSISIISPLLFRWVGFGLIVAPILLAARLRDAKRSILLLVLLVVTFALTLYQARWGYFFVLVFSMSLPWQLSLFKRQWLIWTIFILSLWPVLREWDDMLHPDAALKNEERADKILSRDAAQHVTGAMLAPWWFSPQLVYWSGQPAVAGSSHESLPGIVDSARFYLTEDPAEALAILKNRRVKEVVAYDSNRLVQTSATVLGRVVPANPLAKILDERPHSAPPFVQIVYANPAFKIFRVIE